MLGGRKTLGVQRASGPHLQRVVRGTDRAEVQRTVAADRRLHVVVLHVDGEQAERRHVARVHRHDDPLQPEDVDEAAQQQRAGATERGHGEVPHVQPALDGDLAQRVGLVPGRDLQDPGGACLQVESERPCQLLQTGAGSGHVERDLTTQQVRRDPAEQDVRVGDGGLGAALAVAQRAGVGTGRAWTHLEGAFG